MRDLLNMAWHFVAQKMERNVSLSEEEFVEIKQKTEEISKTISVWVGSRNAELISIGQNCNSSWYIKDTGQKKASYPFDWIFTSEAIIQDLLRTDFSKLVDKDLIISKGFRAGHKIYHDFQFGHRNPASSDSDLEHYKRCIARWNKMMAEQREVIFIYTVLNESEKRSDYTNGFIHDFKHPGFQKPEHFDGMMKLILQKNPNARFAFIEQYTEQSFELEIQQQDEKMIWIRYDALGNNTGVKYLNPLDDEVMKAVYQALGGSNG